MNPISKWLLAISLCVLFLGATVAQSQETCPGEFEPISAADFVSALSPGWNLGNSLDAVEDEGDWNNPPVEEVTFDDIKAAGFKSVRLPVTWAYHFTGSSNTGDSPDWTVNPEWLQRVADVVEMITSRDLYTIVNVHHDSWVWADVTVEGANITMIEEKFYRLWYQIGTKLACVSSRVAFESINEPPGDTEEHATEINKLNGIFLQAINDAGGFNPQRVVNLVGPGQDSIKTSQFFKLPDVNFTNPYAIQFHYYSPYDYVFGAWGKTIWGSDDDKAALDLDFSNIRNNFTDTPLILGEWLPSPVHTETAARWKYFDFLTTTARNYDIANIMWDNGNDLFDRAAHVFRDPTAVDILFQASAGVKNSLPDSTVDINAAEQFSSAYAFHKFGDEVADQTLPFLLNRNVVASIIDGSTELTKGGDYEVAGGNIVLKSAFLSRYFSPTETPGIKTTLTVSFSAGASIQIQLVVWDAPTLESNTSKAVPGADLVVPVTWNGVGKPATMAAFKENGTILVDDWTMWLGPLQQGRTTFNSQWGWDWGRESITITAAAIDLVIAGGQPTTFMIEAYPRVPGNSVNYTLTVE
ncbi:hypothetical protein AJ79_04355 [Helicocarpus griseus UAMH5409]|uniref:Glycoside hydrolase family 5 domain-containing protein n=1 Tax=Helicocarpus griseus UAMH5409 TaxID=1447875 RepID=A0A2B7XTJ7_9EURO|nr:hypothetical protein AJ79_04355 [Helicocarpus griseus UAMH5409]